MGKIKKLDQHTTDLIAAGEVIERAASVVKELVENSIDALATRINIKLIEAGLSEITVSDNGEGMDEKDAKLAVKPHSTSKIKNEKDLFRIQTLGFRGEALPSIVSVSNFKMKTSQDGVRGSVYTMKAGTLVSESVAACPRGTEITVNNLFFNTPARLQNLQPASVELSYILDYLTKIAMAHPEIAFKATNNERVVLQTFGSGRLLEVISNIYKTETAKNLIDIYENNGYFILHGFISKLHVTRSSRNNITVIVNERVVKNTRLVSAIVEGYKERLMFGRYPIAVLNIGVDPSLVDVNIHPAKLEVRFSNEEELLEMVRSSVDNALSRSNLIVDLDESMEQTAVWDSEARQEEVVHEESKLVSLSEQSFTTIQPVETIIKPEVPVPTPAPVAKESFEQQQYTLIEGDVTTNPTEPKFALPKLAYIGQLQGTYLLASDVKNFYLVDQHAAAERVNYEKYILEMQKNEEITYQLLIPLAVNFSLAEAPLVAAMIPNFIRYGLLIEEFGSGSFLVREVPIWIPRGREKEFVEEIITQAINNKKTERYQFLDSLAKSLACKKAIKANDYLNNDEVAALLSDLGKCKNPYTCPHGRPVIVKFSYYEIEKWFKRVV